MRIAALAMIGSLLAPSALSGAKVGDPAPELEPTDVMDRALRVPEKGKVTVLAFVSKSNGEKSGEITRAVRVDRPDVEIVSFVDLSGFPGFLRGTIRGKIRARQPGAVQDARDAFTKAGKTPPSDLDARTHIVPDFDASFCKAYGATNTGKQPRFVVIGADGNVKAVLDAPKAEDVTSAVVKAFEGS